MLTADQFKARKTCRQLDDALVTALGSEDQGKRVHAAASLEILGGAVGGAEAMSSRDAITIRHIAKLRAHWWARYRIGEGHSYLRPRGWAWLRRHANRIDDYFRSDCSRADGMAKLGLKGRRRFK